MNPTRSLWTNNKTATAIKVAAIIVAVAILYRQDLALTFNEAISSELASHILIIPLLFAYLAYRKRKILAAAIPSKPPAPLTRILTHELPGVLLCLSAFIVYWQGSHSFYPLEYHLLSLPIFVAGCVLFLFNLETLRALAFPIAFLLFLSPPPIEAIQGIGATISVFTSQATTTILNLLGLPVTLATEYGNPILNLQTPNGPLEFTIDIACAGIYSLMGFTIFAAFLTYLARGHNWKKAVTFLIGFPLVYTLNIFRLTITVTIGYYLGEEIARVVFHRFSGWLLIFLGTLALLYVSEKALKIGLFGTRLGPPQCFNCRSNDERNEGFCFDCGKVLKSVPIPGSRRDLVKTAVLLICVGLVLPLNVPVFTLTKGPSQLITYSPSSEQVVTEILPQIENHTLDFVYRDETFEELSNQDANLLYVYYAQNKSEANIWVSVEIANSKACLHKWEVCLITYPQKYGRNPTVHTLGRREIQLYENPPIIARLFAFQRINATRAQIVLYWYEDSLFDTGLAIEKKLVKTSVIAFTDRPETYAQVAASLLPFANAIIRYWQPIQSWPWIILMIAAQGEILIIMSVCSIAAVFMLHILREQKQRESNYKAYDKLRLEEERNVLLAVHQANELTKATGNAISTSYQEITGKTIEKSLLHKKLSQAEEAGFLKKIINSVEDVPIITWKPRISFSQ